MTPSKSGWDFGELFNPQTLRRVYSVTELTVTIRRLLEKQVGQIWVSGEISNLRLQTSGHIYFTLKDAGAQLNCVLFRGEAVQQRGLLRDGCQVVLQGEVTVYEPRGQYQLRVTKVELQGFGALQLAFERLKQKLAAEGLFDPGRKRPLPCYPQRIGLVTSPQGAALRDVLHVVRRRYPGLGIVLAPCRVQGEGAAQEIADAIRSLNDWAHPGEIGAEPDTVPQRPRLDLILVTRGGGSLEDLWAFNEEIVARAIVASRLPVVSAVGHEIDFTISDFVADLRAATPSAAAELITQNAFASRQFLSDSARAMAGLARRRCRLESERLRHLLPRLARGHPRYRLETAWQRLDDLLGSLSQLARRQWRDALNQWQSLHQGLVRIRPSQHLLRRREKAAEWSRRLGERAHSRWTAERNRLTQLEARLRLLSPLHVLRRGYSITLDEATDRIIRLADQVKTGSRLKTRLSSGEIRSVVTDPPSPPSTPASSQTKSCDT